VITIVMVLAHVASLYLPNTWVNRDGRFYVNMNATLVEDLSLEQSRFAASWYEGNLGWSRNLDQGWSNVAVGRNGEHWPKHPWLMPVLSTPLFFAFGILGTLLFNVLLFGLVAGTGYRFARAYAPPAPSALAVLALLLGTSVHYYAYDYHTDILLLALTTSTLAALVLRKSFLIGALYAAMLCVKPTTLMLLPAIVLLLWERRGLSALKQVVLGGGAVLACVGAINTYMFGRPWWFGYSRILIVQNGEPVVASVGDAFGVPIREGIARVWSGPWGLRHRQTLMALAAPGALLMLGRHPRYVAAALGTVAASFLIFAQYTYEGDRFHWPAIALLLPALASTLSRSGELLSELSRWFGRRLRITRAQRAVPSTGSAASHRAAWAAAILCVCGQVATMPFDDPPPERIADSGYVVGALVVGSGTLDMQAALGPDYLRNRPASTSPVSRSRFGHWIPCATPPAVAIAAPFAAALGRWGLVLLHVLALAMAAFAAVRALRGSCSPALAAALVTGPLLLPWGRDAVFLAGPATIGAALGTFALWFAVERRWAASAALAVLAAWVVDGPWLLGLSVLAMAVPSGQRAIRRAFVSGFAVFALWGISHFILIGRPFASPNDFLLVDMGGRLTTAAFDSGTPSDALLHVLKAGGGKSLAVLVVLLPLGLLGLWPKNARLALGLAIACGSIALPHVLSTGNNAGHRSPLLILMFTMPMAGLASVAASNTPRSFGRTIIAGLAVLLILGAARTYSASRAPFRLATERAVRSAQVTLGDGIPCDFLPWEHMTWECSHYDRVHFNQVGLALPEGVHVGGRREQMLLIPTGSRQARTARWESVPARSRFRLHFAAPDRPSGGNVRLDVLIDGESVGAVETRGKHDGNVHEVVIDTSPYDGRDVELTLRAASLDRPGAAIAVDGQFIAPPF